LLATNQQDKDKTMETPAKLDDTAINTTDDSAAHDSPIETIENDTLVTATGGWAYAPAYGAWGPRAYAPVAYAAPAYPAYPAYAPVAYAPAYGAWGGRPHWWR
jgi:hypothetical protein